MQKRRALARAVGRDVAAISGVAGTGVPEMLRVLVAVPRQSRASQEASEVSSDE